METRSESLFAKSKKLFPGGVNSPVRAFQAVGGVPRFIDRGEGSYLVDVDGKRYVDYVLSYGPLIHGHAHPLITDAIRQAAESGTSFGMPTEMAIRLAELIQDAIPSLEMMRFVNSGTEATMSAIRLARAVTQRSKIIKFEGCYHGHADHLLVKAGSGVATLGLPDSPGVPMSATNDTMVAPYNDLAAVEGLVQMASGELAAIIVEPFAGNMGLVFPKDGFLEGLRNLCDHCGALLIFDEVMTGFRVAPGGAQGLLGVVPDLTTLGKVIGGGLPVGAYGGPTEFMERIAPTGPVYQAGTLSGNPLAMAAGVAALEHLRSENPWDAFQRDGSRLDQGITNAAQTNGVDIVVGRAGTMASMFFLDRYPSCWSEVRQTDQKQFRVFFHSMLEQGIFFAPSPFEVGFFSTVHSDAEIEKTIDAATVAFGQVEKMNGRLRGSQS